MTQTQTISRGNTVLSNAGYTKRITYSKEFLTGTLAGITVRCEFKTTDDAVAIHMDALSAVKKSNPGAESGGTYWIYNIGCEDLNPCQCIGCRSGVSCFAKPMTEVK